MQINFIINKQICINVCIYTYIYIHMHTYIAFSWVPEFSVFFWLLTLGPFRCKVTARRSFAGAVFMDVPPAEAGCESLRVRFEPWKIHGHPWPIF